MVQGLYNKTFKFKAMDAANEMFHSSTSGQVDFAETTETETRKKKSRASYSTASRNSAVFYFVHSWLGCYMLGRGETEFCSYTTHLIVQSISSPFEHCVFRTTVV